MSVALTAQEPILLVDSSFTLRRVVPAGGELTAQPGDRVEPGSPIGRAAGAARGVVLHLVRDLGIMPEALSRALTKPVGAHFRAGESVARVRHGLRTASVDAPMSGTLAEVNEAAGTATLVPESGAEEILALVHGTVASRPHNHTITIATVGQRVRGAALLGRECRGTLRLAVDRHDRELTPDAVTPEMRDAIVVGGLTAGALALRRLVEVGARAVVVGSVDEGDVRRTVGGAERGIPHFWESFGTGTRLSSEVQRLPLTIFITVGFGRRPMTPRVFQFLAGLEGQTASLVTEPGHPLHTSFLVVTAADAQPRAGSRVVAPADGVPARLADPQHLGTPVTCRGEAHWRVEANGQEHEVVEVELPTGDQRAVPLANLEILAAQG